AALANALPDRRGGNLEQRTIEEANTVAAARELRLDPGAIRHLGTGARDHGQPRQLQYPFRRLPARQGEDRLSGQDEPEVGAAAAVLRAGVQLLQRVDRERRSLAGD